MSKFNVGDKVRVRKDLVVGKDYGDFTFVDAMVELKGKIVTIKKAFTNAYLVEEDTDKCAWANEMFEQVTNWDKVKEEMGLEDFIKHSGICTAIHKVRKEDNCYSTRNCADCKEWLGQPYQEPSTLNDIEKEYLRVVIKPFRDEVTYITLCVNSVNGVNKEYVRVGIKDGVSMCFPDFKAGTMYKGMVINRRYSLKDLDL